MRFFTPAVVLACATLSSATLRLGADNNDAIAEQPNEIKWDVSDFSDNVDIYIGDEDADEDEASGKKIADSTPNVGTYTWIPDKGDAGKKKKKIWGKDKKGKKGKGKKLIGIIIIGPGKQPPYQTHTVPILPPPQQTLPPGQVTLPGTTITSIGTLTRTVPSEVTATHIVTTGIPGQVPPPAPPLQTLVPPPVATPEVPKVPSEVNPLPTVVPPVPIPVPVPTQGQPQLSTTLLVPPTSTFLTQTPGQVTRPVPSNTLVSPTSTGVAPPLFTGAATKYDVKVPLVGAVAGIMVLGML